ncbi:MAG TPA: PQQ-dependent sugar dehydrogenase [Tepidisphaeraceae bacterium]|nr:PQQ-dependent sugar dehydrogenase [Tepidisphaeraceae bacterium]
MNHRLGLLATVVLFASVARAADLPPVQSQGGPVKVESLAKLEMPWGMAYLPDGKLLITEKPGRLRVFADGKVSEPIEGLPAVAFGGQNGLLDVAVDPDFAKNSYVYLSYAEAAESQPEGAKDSPEPRLGAGFKAADPQLKGGAVARGKLEGNKLTGVTVIWRQEPKTMGRGHIGGRMVFGTDGKLYVTSGERQRFEPAQDPASNLGGIVRINPDGSIPTDNPYVGKAGARPDRYTMGNRNPLGAAIHPTTGKLWIHEMGPKGGDELQSIEAGKNYGWPIVAEKATHYNDAPIPDHSTRPEFAAPVKAFTPVISPSGMLFYTGTLFPNWKGSILMGGLSSKAIVRVTLDGDKVASEERLEMKLRIRDLIEAPDGSLLVLTDGKAGELLRLTPGSK